MSAAPFQRALVIRGGALGDFLLTLPVLNALREAAPDSRIEMLAYPGIAALAKSAGIIDDVRSIEYGPLSRFFTRDPALDPGFRDYFASFDLVINYLYDPDGIFTGNLRSAGVRRLIAGPHRPSGASHAIDQLAAPLAEIGVALGKRAARLTVNKSRHKFPIIALHPGSGSAAKNWPKGRWRELVETILSSETGLRIALIGGEADVAEIDAIRGLDDRAEFWVNLPLPELAERLAGARGYVGHDTGISHLAAACGTPCLLLFGPTDPGVWAPPHDHVRILRAPAGKLEEIAVGTVFAAMRPILSTGLRLASDCAAEQTGQE